MRVRVVDVPGGEPPGDEEYLTKNISVGGLFVITEHRYPLGQYLNLRLDYKGMIMESGARVTHIQRDGVGVRFWNATPALEQAMKSLIEDLLATGHYADERRREPRLSIEDMPVLWREGTLEHRASLRDVSLSGAGIESADVPKLGDTILVLLPTPSADLSAISLDLVGSDAVVRRVMDGSFGVEFDAPSAEFRLAVAKMLQQSGEDSGESETR